MLKLPIPEHVYELAQERADAMPILKGSHRGVAGNEVGCLGEVVVEQLLECFGVGFQFKGATSHNLQVGQELWEIKTKDRTVPPQPSYDCSVPLYNSDHQTVDRYIFVSLLRPKGQDRGIRRFSTAYVLGAASRERVFEHGQIWRAGETDPSNGTKFWTDCVNLPISRLDSFVQLLSNVN